jgi:hypothetical protein
MEFLKSVADILRQYPQVHLEDARAYFVYQNNGGCIGTPEDTLDMMPLEMVVRAKICRDINEASERVMRVIEALKNKGDSLPKNP